MQLKHYFILSAILGLFLIFVVITPEYKDKNGTSYLSVPIYLASLLRGDVYNTDLAQENFGFKALITGQDAYPFIVTGRSTHPPTAFLFAAPIAFLPWTIAPPVWAWLSLIVVSISLYLMDFSLMFAVSATLLLSLWTPLTFSLSQITPIWLLGLCLAYRERNRNVLMAGVWIGIASLTKFFPAILLIPFLMRQKWSAIFGFALVWVTSLGIILILSPTAISRYVEVNFKESISFINMPNNASFLLNFYQMLSIPGILVVIALLIAIFWLKKDDYMRNEISRETWHYFSILSVILLPIAWPYSLLPLLPRMIDKAISKESSRLFDICAFIIPLFFPPGAFRQIFITSLLLIILGFVPFHELISQKQTITNFEISE